MEDQCVTDGRKGRFGGFAWRCESDLEPSTLLAHQPLAGKIGQSPVKLGKSCFGSVAIARCDTRPVFCFHGSCFQPLATQPSRSDSETSAKSDDSRYAVEVTQLLIEVLPKISLTVPRPMRLEHEGSIEVFELCFASLLLSRFLCRFLCRLLRLPSLNY